VEQAKPIPKDVPAIFKNERRSNGFFMLSPELQLSHGITRMISLYSLKNNFFIVE